MKFSTVFLSSIIAAQVKSRQSSHRKKYNADFLTSIFLTILQSSKSSTKIRALYKSFDIIYELFIREILFIIFRVKPAYGQQRINFYSALQKIITDDLKPIFGHQSIILSTEILPQLAKNFIFSSGTKRSHQQTTGENRESPAGARSGHTIRWKLALDWSDARVLPDSRFWRKC